MAQAFNGVAEAVQDVYRQMFYFGFVLSLTVVATGLFSPVLSLWWTFIVAVVMMAWSAWQRRRVPDDGR